MESLFSVLPDIMPSHLMAGFSTCAGVQHVQAIGAWLQVHFQQWAHDLGCGPEALLPPLPGIPEEGVCLIMHDRPAQSCACIEDRAGAPSIWATTCNDLQYSAGVSRSKN